MRYYLKPIHCRAWTLNGLPLELIESHYENNYGTALRRLTSTPSWRSYRHFRLHREEGNEFHIGS